jgi:hypothetical protein
MSPKNPKVSYAVAAARLTDGAFPQPEQSFKPLFLGHIQSVGWFALFTWLVIGTIVWVEWAGRDTNWDLLNYHLYVGMAADGSRMGRDFFPASIQSYLSPYGYVPFYKMYVAGWSDRTIALVLASFQASAIAAIYGLAGFIFRQPAPADVMKRQACALLAFLSPVFLQTLGTTFVDGTCAAILLLGLWIAAAGNFRYAKRRDAAFLVAGFLFGASAAIKLTTAPILVVAIPVICWLVYRRDQRLGSIFWLITSSAAGFLVCYAPWGIKLWREFGNPFFPFFNSLFRSDDFPLYSFHHARFIPDSLLEYLIRPFRMVLPENQIYTETIAPDFRYAALCVMALVAGTTAVYFQTTSSSKKLNNKVVQSNKTLPLILLCTFIVVWFVSLAVSGNGRYMTPVGLLVALPLIWIAFKLPLQAKRRNSYGWLAITALIALQVHLIVNSTEARWNGAPFNGKWFEVEVPSALLDKPGLFLVDEAQSLSFLAAFVNPGSAFVNTGGQHILSLHGPGGSRLKDLISKWDGSIFSLSQINVADNRGLPVVTAAQLAREPQLRLGLKQARSQCQLIRIGSTTPLLRTDVIKSVLTHNLPPKPGQYVMTCPLIYDPLASGATQREADRVKQALSVLEKRCQKLFSPQGLEPQKIGSVWRASYTMTDTSVFLTESAVVVSRGDGEASISIGALSDVLAGAFDLSVCNSAKR